MMKKERDKRRGLVAVLGFVFFVAIVLMMNSVSASLFDEVKEGFKSAVSFVLGDVVNIAGADPGEILFIKFLVFILLFAIVNMALKKFPQFGEKRGLTILLSIVVSLISVRYMTSDNLINFIWLPYGLLGVLLSSLFPFIIAFFFIESFDDSPVVRKVGWAAFVVIFAALAILRWDDFAVRGYTVFAGRTIVPDQWYQNLAWIYLIIAILSGFLMFFDSWIRKLIEERKQRKRDREPLYRQLIKKNSELKELNQELAEAVTPDGRKRLKEMIKGVKDRIADLHHDIRHA